MTSELGLTIHSTLEGYVLPGASAPYFAKVFKGEPLALLPGRAVARWKVNRVQESPEGPRVISGEMMRTAVFTVTCYWPLTPMQEAQENTEDDILAVAIDLPPRLKVPALSGDYTLAGVPVSTITVEDIEPITVDFPTPTADVQLRQFSFDIHARLLEES